MICPICDSHRIKTLGPFRSKSKVFSGCRRVLCLTCDMVFTSPMPSESLLSEYNAHYFLNAHADKPTSKISLAFFSGIARLRLAFLRRYLNRYRISVTQVLEVGPGLGFFAKNWIETFPESSYSVIETDITCHKAIQEFGAHIVSNFNNIVTDLVVLSHVLEHVPQPTEFIRSATLGLRKGGVLFIEVPCRDWEHKKMDEPHILFFDKKPLNHLLSKAGFGDIEVSYYGQTINSLRIRTPLYNKMLALRVKLISFGITYPFSKIAEGLETVKCPLERAMVAPFLAHRESKEPAWWLRAVARKL